ncbi:MAG: preprotein translocase subunit SecD [Heteroscytonema crispum UTEX LB 1556]
MKKINQNKRHLNWQYFAIGASYILLLAVGGCGSVNPIKAENTSKNLSTQLSFICPFAGVEITYKVNPTQDGSKVTPEITADVEKVLKKRLDGLGFSQAVVKSISNDQILIQLPGEEEKNTQKIARVLGARANLEFRKQKKGTQAQLQALLEKKRELSLNGDATATAKNQVVLEKNNQALANLFEPAQLTGKYIIEAYAENAIGNSWNIAIKFDTQGEKLFTDLTKSLAGMGRAIGIFIDNQVISTPTVGAEFAKDGITGGSAVITGKFTEAEANDFAVQLRSKALSTSIELLSNQQVKNNRCATPGK